ncbi:MAG: hypothetical protein QG657_3272 [Acidobacteriota bacterium]|nr:hypothetical protein [Acidobacteriota bacterium]
MESIKNIRILEKEANKRGDLFTRLMKDLFLTLGYDNPRFNIHKPGREMDIEAVHRTEKKRMFAECKATEEKSGGDNINKFVGALDAEKRKSPDMGVEGYFVSLSGFKESAIEQEKEAGDRVILIDGQRVIDELIRGNIIVSPLKAMEQATHCAAGHGENVKADESFELLAHDTGWIWVAYFLQNKQKTHFALIHADGEALAQEPAQAIIQADQSVGGDLHTLEYLALAGHPAISDKQVKEALDKYLHYLEQEFGGITLEGMPADQEVGPRRLNLENIFVPLYLVISVEKEQEQGLLASAGDVANRKAKKGPGRLPVGRLISKYPYLAILAAPGAGKTTLIKRLAVAYAFPERRALIADELPDKDWLPLLIRCRQLGATVSSPISEILCDIARRAELNDWKDAFSLLVNRALRDGNVLLLVDGLDEISDESSRVSFVKQLRTFLATYPNVNVVVTSREAGFRIVGGALRAHCREYQIANFDNNDIRRLTLAWHKEVMGDRPDVHEEAEKLANTIWENERVQQLAKNPLLLTTLLLVKRWVGQLPTRRSVLYGKAIEVLLMTWNVEAYQPMELDEAIPQLSFVAFTMMKEGIQRISSRRLNEILMLARKQMPEVLGYTRYSVAEFIKRIEYRSSLLMLSGHDIEDGTLVPMYEFRHLTFQEYLTARAIVDGYYPDRKDEDTLLSVLEPHLMDEKWKEVVPLAAVLAGRNVQPLVQCLIQQCKRLKTTHSDHFPMSPAVLLGQCILDEIQLVPKLLEEALEWIARRINSLSPIIPSLSKGRYGEVFLKVVQDAYMSSDTDLLSLGGALGSIYLHRMGRMRKTEHYQDPLLYEKITNFLESKNTLQKALGVLGVMDIAFYFSDKGPPSELKKQQKLWGEKIVSSLFSDIPYLHIAACWAYVWLGNTGAWTPKRRPDVLSRLLYLWKNSPLPDVKYMARRAISSLLIVDRDLKPLPEPDADSIRFIKKKILVNERWEKVASLVIAFYWKKPWSDEELAGKVKNSKLREPNRTLMLKALNAK